jgi:hypothetical protein
MRRNRAAYFLILLLFSAQVDDSWDIPSSYQNQTVDEDDEYLPVGREQDLQQSSKSQRSVLADPILSPSDFFSYPRTGGVASGTLLDAPVGPSPLYVFMSLQL